MTEPPSDAGALFVAVDVHYLHDSAARAAVVAAGERSFSEVTRTWTAMVRGGAPYKPGEFYLRELPPLRAVIPASADLALIVVDGYVDLDPGGRPGLGAHVHAEFGAPVIGVAKTRFRTATHAAEVFRGQSARPLYVTAAGMAIADAAGVVSQMAGQFRLPDALKLADRLARGVEMAGRCLGDCRALARHCLPVSVTSGPHSELAPLRLLCPPGRRRPRSTAHPTPSPSTPRSSRSSAPSRNGPTSG
ncbi:MAG: endonuclease V [Trebonia sp.]